MKAGSCHRRGVDQVAAGCACVNPDRLITAQLDEEQDWVVDSGYNGTSWYQMDDVGNRNSHRYRYNAGGGPTAYDMTYDQVHPGRAASAKRARRSDGNRAIICARALARAP
jgi:hypothetical protein